MQFAVLYSKKWKTQGSDHCWIQTSFSTKGVKENKVVKKSNFVAVYNFQIDEYYV